MVEQKQVYKCEICGNIVEVLHGGKGELVCCGQPMKLYEANTVDAATEKHVPEVTSIDGGIEVVVGSVAHPMTDAHLIEWIEVLAGDGIQRKYLAADDAPKATFTGVPEHGVVRAYCNLHGLWQAEY